MNTELLTLGTLVPRKVRSGKATAWGEVVNWENRGHAGFHNFTGPGARSWVEEEALIGCCSTTQ